MALMKGIGMFHVLLLKGQGFIYKVDNNRYRTYNATNPPPFNAELVCSNEFSIIKKRARKIMDTSTINGVFADPFCWEDNGLCIACVSAEFVELNSEGRYSVIDGRELGTLREVDAEDENPSVNAANEEIREERNKYGT